MEASKKGVNNVADLVLSKEQEQGVYLRGANILVSAAAGSGKTFVLVERIMKRLMDKENPCNIDEFLLVTFTKAAAGEMRARLLSRIKEEIAKDEKNTHLKSQEYLIYKAKICTIHSFCSDIIKTNFHLLDISPNFRICDEAEDNILKSNILNDILEEEYSGEISRDFEEFVKLFSGKKSDANLNQVVEKLYESAQSELDPNGWIDGIKASLSPTNNDFGETVWGEAILKRGEEIVEAAIELIDQTVKEIEESAELEPRKESFLRDRLMLSELLLACRTSFEGAHKQAQMLEFERLPRAKDADKETLEYLKGIRDSYKSEVSKYFKESFAKNSHQCFDDIEKVKKGCTKLCDLTLLFSERYFEQKKQKNVLTFNDLEHLAYELLIDKNGQKTAVAMEIASSYKEILVDEYQDINELQNAIFNAISSSNLFMVGDVKQSIYKFRKAKPEIFTNKYLEFASIDEGVFNCEKSTKINFSANYRSRKNVLEFVNFLFGKIMSPEVGEIEYDDKQMLYPKAAYDEKDVAVELIIGQKSLIAENDDSNETDIEIEGHLIAAKITQLFEKGTMVYDIKKKESRPLLFSDIAILLRSQAGRANKLEKMLLEYGIPSTTQESESYLESTEIMLILCLLEVVDNPLQDIPLIAIMRSSIFNFTEDEILKIKENGGKTLFYDCLLKAEDEKSRAFICKLKEYRKISKELTIDAFLWHIYEDTGYYYSLLPTKNGEKRINNLKMLYEYGRKYEESSYKGLFNFISYINNIININGDLLPHKNAKEETDSVKIMTIHKSKGLEFPVCIVANCAKGFNLLDLKGDLLLHPKLFAGVQCKDEQKSITYESHMKKGVKIALKNEMLSEEERVLYVALTRAKEHLIIVGVCDSITKMVEKCARGIFGDTVQKNHIKNASNVLEWIVTALLLHSDGGKLREQLGVREIIPINAKGKINIEIVDKIENMVQNISSDSVENVETSYDFSRFDKEYEGSELSTIPAKTSVTELKGKMLEQELLEDTKVEYTKKTIFDPPIFITQKVGLTAPQIGTATHTVMQYINYSRTETVEQIKEEIAKMLHEQRLTEQEASCINIVKIHKFFQSELGVRLKSAKHHFREEKFNLLLQASELFENAKGGEKTLVQGVIDAFFIEDDGCVLVDFKTDKIIKEGAQQVAKKYEMQIAVYKKAIEEIYNLKVKESYFYFFDIDSEIAL